MKDSGNDRKVALEGQWSKGVGKQNNRNPNRSLCSVHNTRTQWNSGSRNSMEKDSLFVLFTMVKK